MPLAPAARVGPTAFLAIALLTAPACNCGNKIGALQNVDGNPSAPATLDFGLVTVGTVSAKDLPLLNSGNGALGVTAASISGDSSFQLVNFAPTSDGAGDTIPIHLQFAPTTPGPKTATLTLSTDSEAEPVAVQLTGIGVIFSVAVTPSQIDFGCVEVDAGAPTQSITITNSSSETEDVTIGSLGSPSAFQLTPGPGPQSLPAGQSVVVTVAFTPNGLGDNTSTLSISPCSNCTPTEITITGWGASAALIPSQTFINFGSVPTGATLVSPDVTLSVATLPAGSGCNLPVTLQPPPGLAKGNDGFAVSAVGTWPTTLLSPATVQVAVQYTGQANGVVSSDTALVAYSVMSEPQPSMPIQLNASSVSAPCQDLVATPISIDFGTVAIGKAANWYTTLTNKGSVTCNIDSVAINPNDTYGEFSLQAGIPTTLQLAGGGSTSIPVLFTPSNNTPPLVRSGILVITTNDPQASPINVQLSATVGSSNCSGSGPATGDGVGAAAILQSPTGLAYDSRGTGALYLADTGSGTIRKIDIASAAVTTIAGDFGTFGSHDDLSTCATFFAPWNVAFDGENRLFVTDTNNELIRQVALDTSAVTTIAGSLGVQGHQDGIGAAASFYYPENLVYMAGGEADAGQLLIADCYNGVVRQMDLGSQNVTTLGLQFSQPWGLVLDGLGNLFVGAFADYTVYKVNLSSSTDLTVGTSTNYISGLALDGQGNIFIADRRNGAILQMSIATGAVTTLAGQRGNEGFADGVGTAAQFNEPNGLVYDGVGTLYVGDQANNAVRAVVVDGGIVSTLAGR